MLPMKLKVNELTRAEREGRTHRGKTIPAEAVEENGEEISKEEASEEEEASDEDGTPVCSRYVQHSAHQHASLVLKILNSSSHELIIQRQS